MAERSSVKQPKKAPKTLEFLDTGSDIEDKHESTVKQPKEAPETPEFVHTGSDTSNE